MTAIVRPAQSRDIDGICQLLHEKMNSRYAIERWRRIMSYPWLEQKPDFGQLVEEGGRILGYCGMIYSDRVIGNEAQGYRKARFVSMTSWYLDKSLRGQGLGKQMLLATRQDPTLTYTMFTNSPKPLPMIKALGYQVLDEVRYHWHRTGPAGKDIVLIRDVARIRERANPLQRQLLHDMQDMPIEPVWLVRGDRETLLFLSIRTKGENVLWFDLLHAGDPALFTECAPSLANHLLPVTPSVLASDSRLIAPPPADTVRQLLPVARHYWSQDVQPRDIDFLYSELQLLDQKLD